MDSASVNHADGSPICAECDGNPAETTAHGLCTACGAGTCRTCDGEGVTYVRTAIDDEREASCEDCHPDAWTAQDYEDAHGDALYDQQRDDRGI